MTITEKNEKTAITAVESAPIQAMPSQGQGGYINTLNMESYEGRLMTARAINGAESLVDMPGTTIKVCDVVTMPGKRKSRQVGVEDSPCTNVYIIDDQGEAWFSQSEGIANSVEMLHAIFGDFKASPDGYLECEVIETVTATGNTVKKLNPLL